VNGQGWYKRLGLVRWGTDSAGLGLWLLLGTRGHDLGGIQDGFAGWLMGVVAWLV